MYIYDFIWESFIILEGNWSKKPAKTINGFNTLIFVISISNNVLVKISIGTSYFELY
jgi:hypothetical protein